MHSNSQYTHPLEVAKYNWPRKLRFGNVVLVADQGFPIGGGGALAYYGVKFSWKLHDNVENQA